MPCFIALLQLHIGQSLDLQNHTRYNFLSPVSRFCLYSNISAQSFTLSAFLNSRICRSSKRSEEHTSELQSRFDLVCRLLLEKKKTEYELIIVGLELSQK